MTEPIIQVENFRKTYGDFVAVDGISITVQPGEIFGLLGPNGAGKTSTLECLEGLRSPNAGRLRVAGIDPAAEPRRDGRPQGERGPVANPVRAERRPDAAAGGEGGRGPRRNRSGGGGQRRAG